MKKELKNILGVALGMAALTPTYATAALVEYSGFRNMVIGGVERRVSLSITINDEFREGNPTVQYMRDNYPPYASIDRYYGYFDIHNAEVNIEGAAPVTSDSGRFYIWVTDLDYTGGSGYDLSSLRLETEDVVTDWSSNSRIQFLDESASPYDWASWWGDTPSNDLPTMLDVNRLDLLGAGDYSGYYNLYEDPFLLRPVPIPAAAWLFGSGMIGLLGVVRRRKAVPGEQSAI